MPDTTEFTVIVPTYERASLVCETVAAIDRMSTQHSFEIVVVIDGSTDDTADRLRSLDLSHPLKVIEQENGGVAAARNRGASEAAGAILLFLDDDLTSDPGLLDVHAREHANGADMVIGHIPIDPRTPPGLLTDAIAAWAESRARDLPLGETIPLEELQCGQMSIARELFAAVGGFDEGFTQSGKYGNEDLDFGLRIKAGHTVRFAADAISYQRYVVTPAQNLQQAAQSGAADVRLAEKHPERSEQIFAAHWPHRKRARLIYRPMAKSPFLTRAACSLAGFLAEHCYGFSPATDRFCLRAFANLREIAYWSGVHDARKSGGLASG